MKILTSIALLICFVSSHSQYENVLIHIEDDMGGYAPCEPSIAISYKNQKNIVAGAVLDKVYTSNDEGKTWSISQLKSPYGVYGDPCIISDHKGKFYYFHLSNPSGDGRSDDSWLDRIVCQYSKNNGKKWSSGTSIGNNGEKDQDKEWAVANPKNGHVYATWTQFDRYNSKLEGDSTVILFSKSKGKKKLWSTPVRINEFAGDCLDDDQTVEGAVPTIGPKGEIYVAWSLNESIYFDRSYDEGETWLKHDVVAGKIFGGWNHQIPGIGRANGMPVTKCDISGGPNDGTIYINYSDQANGEDNTDIWIIKSSDSGDSWSKPLKVNTDDSGKHQFFTWMDIDPVTGYIYIVFYDRRNYNDNQTDVYLATSTDGGSTFTNECISESAFTPTTDVFFGDYNNISAYNGVVRPIWTRCENSILSIWTALINK